MFNPLITLSIFIIFLTPLAMSGLENGLSYPTKLHQFNEQTQQRLMGKVVNYLYFMELVGSKKIPDPEKNEVFEKFKTNSSFRKNLDISLQARSKKGVTTPLSVLPDFFMGILETEHLATFIPSFIDKFIENTSQPIDNKHEKDINDAMTKIKSTQQMLRQDPKLKNDGVKYSVLTNTSQNLEVIRIQMSHENDLDTLKKSLKAEHYKQILGIFEQKKTKSNRSIFENLALLYTSQSLPLEEFRKLCLDDTQNCYKGFENTYNAIMDIVTSEDFEKVKIRDPILQYFDSQHLSGSVAR